jgi:sialic acid synthase SpsE
MASNIFTNLFSEKITKPVVIAEFGVNHGNDLEVAKQGIKLAAQAGADAIKFQTYTADELVCKNTPKFWEHESAEGKNQHEAYQDIGGFPYEWYPELIKTCEENGIEFLSTPFSFEAADKLNELGMKAFKIASSDMSHLPFLKYIAKFGKPILLSTGAATMEEIKEAVLTIRNEGNDQIVVMHCTLCYPTKAVDANLKAIVTLKRTFKDLAIGLSDHTLGLVAPTMAVGYGATVIEKHFTHDKSLKTTADHWLSVDPQELEELCINVKEAFQMIGTGLRDEVPYCESKTRLYDKRSIVSKVFIPKGTRITEGMIAYKRPGTGLWPKHLDIVLDSVAKIHIAEDIPITFEMLT